ncbi:MAG TPA: NAD(P)-dependent oxidoreductase [Vicinamibacterales bacterium]|nr:NAD(P)-dependent oxidoreductase [Vicinamibacterales bacterium]
MPSSRSYFVTGALGCIGAWVLKALVERGDQPAAFDIGHDRRRLEAIMSPAQLDRILFLHGDITAPNDVRQALDDSGADRVIHLAGLQVPGCRQDPIAGARVNVIGTLNVFEAARSIGLDHIVYASSAAVFGLADEAVDESVAPAPLTHYGVFKQANEGSARVYFHEHGLSSIGLRPFTVYGVGRDSGLTSDPTRAMKAALAGRRFHIRFSGTSDFLYVADAAAAFIACADRRPEGAHVFNLHGETHDVDTVVRTIEETLPADARGLITFGGPPIPMPPALDDAALRRLIPALPRTSLEQGVRETIGRFTALRDEGRLDLRDLEA